jgi:hypothetical protein
MLAADPGRAEVAKALMEECQQPCWIAIALSPRHARVTALKPRASEDDGLKASEWSNASSAVA